MVRTENQIEQDFYLMLKDSALGGEIRGNVYRQQMRPYDGKDEDIVLKFLSGNDGQIQTGTVVFDIYVPDIRLSDGRMVADKQRIGELESLVIDFIESSRKCPYRLETDGSMTVRENKDIGQHFIYARIKFKLFTD